MQPRKRVGVDPTLNYDELSPADLIESLNLEQAVVDQDEFSRAEWFWNRLPKVFFENLIFLFCYTIVFVCLLYLVPESCPSLFVWTVAGAGSALVEWFRLDRWRNEYVGRGKKPTLDELERQKPNEPPYHRPDLSQTATRTFGGGGHRREALGVARYNVVGSSLIAPKALKAFGVGCGFKPHPTCN